jgi:hypothetical protein
MAAQSAQNNFLDAQRVATQAWQTGENIRDIDADKAAQYFDSQQKVLLQKNDLDGQRKFESWGTLGHFLVVYGIHQEEEKITLLVHSVSRLGHRNMEVRKHEIASWAPAR